MLLISYLYGISERQVEILANDSLSIGFFPGLGADEKAPDHSTITLFKNRLINNAGASAYEELFSEIIIVAMEHGVKFGKLQVVDSIHTIADVNQIWKLWCLLYLLALRMRSGTPWGCWSELTTLVFPAQHIY